jgi:hypothetical protein
VKPLLVAAVLIAAAAPAFVADDDVSNKLTGNALLPHCRALVDDDFATTPGAGLCAGMISTLFWSQRTLGGSLKFCAPSKSITRGQSRQVVLRYLENHPELLHLDIRLLAADAMREAWPCSWWQRLW